MDSSFLGALNQLGRIATALFATTASSATIERVFSKAKFVLQNRGRLSMAHFEREALLRCYLTSLPGSLKNLDSDELPHNVTYREYLQQLTAVADVLHRHRHMSLVVPLNDK